MDAEDYSAMHISIHTSREGCDQEQMGDTGIPDLFQSTHPARDVTTAAENTEFATL